MIESLEERRLLAVTAVLNAGVLTITGDDADNKIKVEVDRRGQLVVESDRQKIFSASAGKVTAIKADLAGGNDEFETDKIKVPVTVHGGAGNDKLEGGDAKDEIFGDDGDDELRSDDGVVDRVDGGAGYDSAEVDANDIVINVEKVDIGSGGRR